MFNCGTRTPIQGGTVYLEIFKEEGELMPRAMQARERSADGN
jgi:hypothetical protein